MSESTNGNQLKLSDRALTLLVAVIVGTIGGNFATALWSGTPNTAAEAVREVTTGVGQDIYQELRSLRVLLDTRIDENTRLILMNDHRANLRIDSLKTLIKQGFAGVDGYLSPHHPLTKEEQ